MQSSTRIPCGFIDCPSSECIMQTITPKPAGQIRIRARTRILELAGGYAFAFT